MDYNTKLKHHYQPAKGWINDPNGLVYFKGYYHLFYQHSPNYETPWKEPMHWGHARTKDFCVFEELDIALYPDKAYDNGGCWSGTATVKDDTLYLIYTSIYTPEGKEEKIQKVCVASSKDGINFEKYEGNPVIETYPEDGCPEFRDPAVTYIDGKYYLVMATGCPEKQEARLLIYESDNLTDWKYNGIMHSWDNSKYAECPSFMETKQGFLLSSSVLETSGWPFFTVMYGNFENGIYTPTISACPDKGPDQYAGQIFLDPKGRSILITWIPGWSYNGFAETDIGCLSVPREIFVKDEKVHCYPIEEVRHLLKDSDPALKRTEDGFIVERNKREPLVYKGKIDELKILRDEYIIEIFINGGEETYSALL